MTRYEVEALIRILDGSNVNLSGRSFLENTNSFCRLSWRNCRVSSVRTSLQEVMHESSLFNIGPRHIMRQSSLHAIRDFKRVYRPSALFFLAEIRQ